MMAYRLIDAKPLFEPFFILEPRERNSVIFKKIKIHPDSKVRGANVGPTWVLSAPDGPNDSGSHPRFYGESIYTKLKTVVS